MPRLVVRPFCPLAKGEECVGAVCALAVRLGGEGESDYACAVALMASREGAAVVSRRDEAHDPLTRTGAS